ncbi:hypothetical protein BLOT_008529 [Blomia tropicalis]|nr:hypothetical protein BLOT_008529 [Blomia tropicalis]
MLEKDVPGNSYHNSFEHEICFTCFVSSRPCRGRLLPINLPGLSCTSRTIFVRNKTPSKKYRIQTQTTETLILYLGHDPTPFSVQQKRSVQT